MSPSSTPRTRARAVSSAGDCVAGTYGWWPGIWREDLGLSVTCRPTVRWGGRRGRRPGELGLDPPGDWGGGEHGGPPRLARLSRRPCIAPRCLAAPTPHH